MLRLFWVANFAKVTKTIVMYNILFHTALYIYIYIYIYIYTPLWYWYLYVHTSAFLRSYSSIKYNVSIKVLISRLHIRFLKLMQKGLIAYGTIWGKNNVTYLQPMNPFIREIILMLHYTLPDSPPANNRGHSGKSSVLFNTTRKNVKNLTLFI